ncbi:MAG TPA: hypothetical protein VLX31_13970 [Streptosporangiaceae bacterium]|nr:hypothetical protein [Streptosporangiaceae bacterium]
MPQPAAEPAAGQPSSPGLISRLTVLARSIPRVLRRNWLASILITCGAVLRILTEMAYHPAIIYIDSLKYLYDAWPGADPVGYKIPLKMILAVGDLGTVEFVQHLLGIAIAVTIYLVMVRRGVVRWLAALAIAPVLLDAYQLNVEAMIMPDVWFEAFIVGGLAMLLWRENLTLPMAMIGGALLGGSVGLRQVGEVLIIPALIIVAVMGGGWNTIARRATAVTMAFALAVLFYLSASYELTGHFWISRSSVSLTYGRMAAVAGCATLKLPAIERPLCPDKRQQAAGPDWLDHSVYSPLRTYGNVLPPSLANNHDNLVVNFNHAVESQQPLRVIRAIARDSVKLFALTRDTSPGDTPIARWQFQKTFPTQGYTPWVTVKNDRIWVDTGTLASSSVSELKPSYGGPPQVDKPIADFLRAYQLHGGYTPGPLYLLCVIVGLIGSVLAFARRRLNPVRRELALGCLAFFITGLLVLGVSDVFEFTWRYQLPALVTLPPAGAFGLSVLLLARRRRAAEPGDTVSERAPEMATPAQ